MKVARAEPAGLLAAEPREDHRPLRPLPFARLLGQLQHRHRSRRIVVRAVEDGVGVAAAPCGARAAAEVIEMRREQDDLGRPRLVAVPVNLPDRIPGMRRPARGFTSAVQRDRRAVGQRRERRIGLLVDERRTSGGPGRDRRVRGCAPQAREPGRQGRPAARAICRSRPSGSRRRRQSLARRSAAADPASSRTAPGCYRNAGLELLQRAGFVAAAQALDEHLLAVRQRAAGI